MMTGAAGITKLTGIAPQFLVDVSMRRFHVDDPDGYTLCSANRRPDNMPPVSVYRLSIWLPILVPAAVLLVANTFDLRIANGVVWEVLAYSLLYGGLPYSALATWATWWVGRHTEIEIRRLMFRAPLLMAVIFVPLALIVGVAVGARGPFAAVAGLGFLMIVALGYGYVGVAVLLRRSLGPRHQVT